MISFSFDKTNQLPYTGVSGKISILLQKVRTTGIPPKVDNNWLVTVGFKSSNDRPLLKVLRFVGFINDSSNPTELWRSYKGGNYKKLLGDALTNFYSHLFNLYSDAPQRSITDLEDFFRIQTDSGDQVVKQTVNTFKALVTEAEFGKSTDEQVTLPNDSDVSRAPDNSRANVTPPLIPLNSENPSPSLHIDIQIHISPESSPEQIEQIFSSMAKHIYKRSE